MKALLVGLLYCVAIFAPLDARASAVPIDNGVTGDGAWRVEVGFGGDSDTGVLDPAGPIGPSDVIFALATLVDPGADGGAELLSNTTITGNPTLTAPGQVSSSGTFAGANGAVNWNSVSTIAPGSLTYQNTVTFTSASPFGTLRVLCYLDEDVVGSSDDIMVLLGTPGQADFNVLTVDNTDNFGVAHAAGYLTATNATYVGWAADEYSDLINAIANAGTTYSIPGVIDTTSLPPITDPRYPGRPVYGPNDITNAFAFDVSPTATTATIACSLGGLPTGQLPTLSISKSAAGSAPVGSNLTYTLRYANNGSGVSGVVIQDRLPMGATFVSASNGGTLAGDTVTWNIGDLPANSGERTLTLVVRVTGVAGSVITNSQYSIGCPCMPSVTGPPVSTTLTASTVVIPPIVPNASACSIVPLPPNVQGNSLANQISSDGNFIFFGVSDPARQDPRFTNPVQVQEVSVYNRSTQTTRVLTSNSPQGWDQVDPISGNRAWLISVPENPLSPAGPVREPGRIVLTDAATGSSTPLSTPFRTATEAAGMRYDVNFIAAAYGGNRILLSESAIDTNGSFVSGGLHLVDIAAQTQINLSDRLRTISGLTSAQLDPFLDFFVVSGDGNRVAFESQVVLTGPTAGTRVDNLPGNAYRLISFVYVYDVAANSITLVAQPDFSRPRPSGASRRVFTRGLGATGTLVPLDRGVPFFGTPGNPEQNHEIYVAQPGLSITQVTSTALPRSGNIFSPSLAHITPNERFIYFNAEQDLVGRNADQSNELYRYDIQTGQLRQVTTRFNAFADVLASLGLTATPFPEQLGGERTSFDGRFVFLGTFGSSTTVDLGGGARAVVAETSTLFDCQ